MKIITIGSQLLEKYWVIAVLGAGVVFFLLTMLLSMGQPVWFDEGYSLLLAKSSFSELFSLTGVDAHPPLYYILLKLWGSVFGFGEYAIRSLSAVLMSGAVVVAVLTLRRLFSTRVALTALPFILLAPFLLRYGYEVRMYALATFIAVSATYALVRARVSEGWQWWAVYAVFVALGMYTLYMIVAVWIAHFVWLLIDSLKSKAGPFWRWPWLYAFAGAVVLFSPYIATFFHQLIYSALPGMGNEMTIPQLANIVSMLLLYAPEWSLGGWGTILILAFAVVLVSLGVKVYRSLDVDEKKGYMLLVALTTVPVVFYALTSLPPRDPIFIVRYMAHSAVFIYMLIGVTLALALMLKSKTRAARMRVFVAAAGVLCVLVLGVFTLQKSGNFVFERMQKPMTHAVQAAVKCDDSTMVIAADPYTYIDSVYYFEECPLYFYSENDVEFKGGYAMLHQSDRRIAAPADITAETVIYLGWKGKEPTVELGERYRVAGQEVFDKQLVTRYELIVE